jgi:cellulose synthase/poly-beta-1,6-N-acetylglucosamine synthase-like glycosyltransferase
MLNLLLIPIAVLYLTVVVALFIYGVNFFYLTFLAWRKRDWRSVVAPMSELPFVTVQLPIYNELYVAERLIDAVANLDYSADRLEIQVLDDSTDETIQVVHRAVERWRARGICIEQIRRTKRVGYKAGALANGLALARGEFLAIFDADFVPSPDFLKRTLPHFQNPRVAFIQTRWGHVNREYSLFTLLQSLAIDAHFMVEQFARSQSGYWFNFNGTAGVWRRSALQDAGGWTSDTLTEDLDLSYRAFLHGWQAVYLAEVECPAELPVSFSAYRRQQHRWARGSFECALKLISQVWNAPISFPQKVEATLHLTGYGVHLLLAALVLLYPFVLVLSQQYPGLVSLFGIALVFNVTTFAPTIFFVIAQRQLGRRWWRLLPAILFITVLGSGMMLNTLRAALQIAVKPSGVFERTPKFGIAQPKQSWIGRRYQLRLDRIVFFEIALALFNIGTALLAVHARNWSIAAYANLFAVGLLFTSGMTIAQTVAVHRQRA